MTHPKPFGELSRAEKGELLLSRHEGKLVEILTSRHGWLTAREYDFWDEARHYRIAPEPLIPDSINWDHVAPEYNCMARDEYLLARLYRNKPVISGTFWTDGEISIYAKYFSSYKRGTVDWEDSLVIRPGHESSKP